MSTVNIKSNKNSEETSSFDTSMCFFTVEHILRFATLPNTVRLYNAYNIHINSYALYGRDTGDLPVSEYVYTYQHAVMS